MAAKTQPKRATRATPKRDWRPTFLEALAQHPDVSKACATAGINRTTAYRARQADEDFAIAWSDAHAKSLDELEAALFARAVDSDTTAAIFLLKSHRPDVYGDRQRIEHSGSIKTDLQSMSVEDLQALADGLTVKRART